MSIVRSIRTGLIDDSITKSSVSGSATSAPSSSEINQSKSRCRGAMAVASPMSSGTTKYAIEEGATSWQHWAATNVETVNKIHMRAFGAASAYFIANNWTADTVSLSQSIRKAMAGHFARTLNPEVGR